MVRNHWVRAVVFCLVMMGLMAYPIATTSAHSSAAGIVAPITERPDASAVEVDGWTVIIAHYEHGKLTGAHEVPLDWWILAIKKVGLDEEKIDDLYHYCLQEEHRDEPICKPLYGI